MSMERRLDASSLDKHRFTDSNLTTLKGTN